MADIIQIRRDTAANWTSVDPTLANGEMGYETDTGKSKMGDGVTAWTSLSYHVDPTGGGLFSEDGNDNVFGGTNAGAALSSGLRNFFGGVSSGQFPDGDDNIGIGYQTLEGTVSNDFSRSIGIGYQAGLALTTGSNNLLLGYQAGLNLTSGLRNVFVGNGAGQEDQVGDNNVAVGYHALLSTASNSHAGNVAIGSFALSVITTGNNNVALGISSAINITSGSNNIAIGSLINPLSATTDNQFALGTTTYPFLRGDMANYQLAIYGANGYLNFNTTLGSGGYGIRDNATVMEYKDSGGSWTTFASLSDISLKNSIRNWDLGLDFIDQLRPVKFEYNNKPGKKQHGLIAQHVKEALDSCGADFSGWYERPDKLQGLDYQKLVIPLINAVKQLKKEIEELKKCLPTPLVQ